MQKKNLFGILILIAYFASCNQIHKTHYENGWYHILSQQKDSIAKESIVTVKDIHDYLVEQGTDADIRAHMEQYMEQYCVF